MSPAFIVRHEMIRSLRFASQTSLFLDGVSLSFNMIAVLKNSVLFNVSFFFFLPIT